MSKRLDISVAICTWNRASLLEITLERILGMRIPSDVSWELLVIDNGCSDHTPQVLEKYQKLLPLVSLEEAKLGHSHARNCAVNHASGEWMLWTDDDVRVDVNWLSAYRDAIDVHRDCDFFGGPIRPWFETPPPAWVTTCIDMLEGPFAIRDVETLRRPISAANLPFGANMAFRTSLLKERPFDTRVGRVGKGMMSGDETTMFRQLLAEGKRGEWVPEAMVEHFIPSKRLKPSYIYAFSRGLAEGEMAQSSQRGPFPRWCLRKWFEASVARLIGRRQPNRQWLKAWVEAGRAEGTIRGWLAHSAASSVNNELNQSVSL